MNHPRCLYIFFTNTLSFIFFEKTNLCPISSRRVAHYASLSAEKILRDHLTVYFGSAGGDKRPHCAAEWFCRALSKCKHANTWLKTNLIQIDFRFCSCCDQHLLYYMAMGGRSTDTPKMYYIIYEQPLRHCVRWVHDSVPQRSDGL